MGCSSHRLGLLGTLGGLLLSGCAQMGSWSAPRTAQKPAADRMDRPFALARLTERKGNLQNAEQMYRSLQSQHGNTPELEHRMGVVAARQGRFEEARQHFANAAAGGRESPELMTDLGYCCYLMDDLPAAEHALRSALARDPNSQRARNNLGLVLGGQGRMDESMAQFKLAGSEAEAHSNLAYVYSQTGDLKRAAEEYNLALSLNQQLRPAAEALVQIAREEPAREKARELAAARQREMRQPQRGMQPAGAAMIAQAPNREVQGPPAPPQIAMLPSSGPAAMKREVETPRLTPPVRANADTPVVTVSHERRSETDNRVTPLPTTVVETQPQRAAMQPATVRSQPAVTMATATLRQEPAPPARPQPATAEMENKPQASVTVVGGAGQQAPISISDYRMDESDSSSSSYRRGWRMGVRR
jgi:Flp pilus assembly protein TadD